MSILDSAELAMQSTVNVGTKGLKLTGNIRAAVEAIDNICDIWEGVETDPAYAANLEMALGAEGVAAANEVYLVFKDSQVALRAKGL